MGLHLLYLAILLPFMVTVSERCDERCGAVDVPYPFGLRGSKCSSSKYPSFTLDCNYTTTPPRLLLRNISVINISVERATATVELPTTYMCHNKGGKRLEKLHFNLTAPFTFSVQNRHFGIGCDTFASFSDLEEQQFKSVCFTLCSSNNRRNLPNPINFTKALISCSGIGCCQNQVPRGLRGINYAVLTLDNHSTQLDTNPCSYSFLADPTWYNNSGNFTLKDDSEKHRYSQALLEWVLPIYEKMTCEQAQSSAGENDEFVCGENTFCTDSSSSPGYLCACKEGFRGNPYTPEGCEDIDECADKTKNPCKIGKCINTAGDYTCQCPFGKQGDGKIGCRMHTAIELIIGGGSSIMLLSLLVFLSWRYRKYIQERNHMNNGGLLLDHLSVKSFTESQLEKATNNFDARRLVGEGGNGSVYRGSLPDMTDLAVKKSKLVDQNQIEQFLNEVDIVSKINHKNVVKLIGVCLQSKVPMLIYEFVPNGTLYHHLHGMNSRITDSWRICVRIAAEIARALDYMHSLADPPILHRDIKSANILLDATYTAKVADFGASMLIPLDKTLAPTQGQGTMGYMDPEYLQTGELSTKSDVYGFGIVLMELLSKRKPISRGSSGETISLVKVFTSAVINDQLHQILRVAEVTDLETEHVHLVAKLATKCVAMPSTNRPTMTKVADELNGISKEYKSFPVDRGGYDVVSLLDDQDVTYDNIT